MEDSTEGACGNITPAPGNSGKAPVHRVPPDFMGARTLAGKLAAQLVESLSQYSICHTGTRSSAWKGGSTDCSA